MNDTHRVVVVGAGASGMAAAIAASVSGAHVCLLEALPKAGRTVMASGNGRCNFANADLSPERYNAPSFVAATMGADPLEPILAFFGNLGLWWCSDDEGRLYPRSRAAASVLDVLLAGLDAYGVDLRLEARVEGVRRGRVRDGAPWVVELESGERLGCDAVVWAAGGGSAGVPERCLDLPRTPERPALCPLALDPKPAKALDGVRVNCAVELWDGSSCVTRQEGEVLFRPYGVSGIVVFDLSRLAYAGDRLVLDLLPDTEEAELVEVLERRMGYLSGRLDSSQGRLSFLDGALHPKVARHVMECHFGRDGRRAVDPVRLAHQLKCWEFAVKGAADEAHAQVTQGGLDLAAFDPQTLESRRALGFFACGEALDVDGACGGLNLSWAWSSGMVAGVAAARLACGMNDA